MNLNKKILEVIACPLCKGELKYHCENEELICRFDRIAYPVREGIPIMLEHEGRVVALEELDKY